MISPLLCQVAGDYHSMTLKMELYVYGVGILIVNMMINQII